MIQLPSDENIPFTKIRKKFSELFAYLKRVRPIEGGLIEMTPNGFKVNRPLERRFYPQFAPTVVRAFDEAGGADASGTKLFIRTGYVFGPWDYDGSDSDRLNAINQFPFEPKIGTTLLSADDPPSLTLEPGYTNFILLKIDWSQRVDVIGKSASGGSFIIAPSLLLESFVTIDGQNQPVTINSSDPSTHNGVVVEISETNYYVTNVSIISQIEENMPQENGSTFILMGHFTLDNFGAVTGQRWFVEGPVWTHKHPRVVDSTTDADDRTEPPAPIDPADLTLENIHDIPGYVETG
tara:strand:+ start:7595 stop:8476 length:882 start_codon:yes stop_codon:yes gene_type:complete